MSAQRLFATLRVTAENAPFYLVKGKWKSPAAQGEGERERLQRLTDATDEQIDERVYELYGLTPEEIAIVEGRSA